MMTLDMEDHGMDCVVQRVMRLEELYCEALTLFCWALAVTPLQSPHNT